MLAPEVGAGADTLRLQKDIPVLVPLQRAFRRPTDRLEDRLLALCIGQHTDQLLSIVGMFVDHPVDECLNLRTISIDSKGSMSGGERQDGKQ